MVARTVRARSTVDFGSVSWLSGASLWFRSSLFEDVATFSGARFPRRAANIGSAFAGARFVRAPNFTSTGRAWVSALDRVVLERLYTRLEGLVHEEFERLPVLPLEEVPPEPRFDR